MNEAARVATEQQKRQNLRLALILASAAIAFFAGFMIKAAFFGL